MDGAEKYEKVPTKEAVSDNEKIPTEYGYGVRHVQTFIFFMCLCIGFIARGHLGVTIVAMTNLPESEDANVITIDNATLVEEMYIANSTVITNLINETNNEVLFNDTTMKTNNTISKHGYKTYEWSKSIQEMVIGSFFFGYCVAMFPIGLVAQRWGGKLPMQIALFSNGLASIMSPWLTDWGGWKALCFCRVLQGLTQSGFFPGLHTLLAHWVPLSERARLSSYAYTGGTFGTILAYQMAGLLASSRWGWPSVFWMTGVLCLTMSVVLTVFGAATPDEHKSISEKEKRFIWGHAGLGSKKRRQVPWKAILMSKHVWATFVTHTASGVSFIFFLTQMPSYLYHILGFNLQDSGFISSLPYIFSVFSCILVGMMSDFLTNRNIVSLKTARNISNSIGQIGPSIFLTTLSFLSNTYLAVICFIFIIATHVSIHSGWMVNYIDLSPNFSGTLMAVGNTITTIISVGLPFLVSNIVTDVKNLYQWRTMFILLSAATAICNIVFILFSSADVQPWNDDDGEIIELESLKTEAKKK